MLCEAKWDREGPASKASGREDKSWNEMEWRLLSSAIEYLVPN